MHPVHIWLLHLLKSFAIVTTKLTFGKYKLQLPKEEYIYPREHEYFITYSPYFFNIPLAAIIPVAAAPVIDPDIPAASPAE